MCLTLCLGRTGRTSEPLGPGVINLTGPLQSSEAWFVAFLKESVQSSSIKPFGVLEQEKSCSPTSRMVAWVSGEGMCPSLRCIK